MLGKLIKLGLLLLVGILGYNYFFGTAEEQATSKKIFGQVKEVAVSVKGLLKNEKEKFDAGKYDKALEKLGNAYKGLRKQLSHVDKKLIDRIDRLEKRRAKLQSEVKDAEASGDKTKQKKLAEKLKQLAEDSEKLKDFIKKD